MYCPNCSTYLCFCESCKTLSNFLTQNKNSELFVCKRCRFTRPMVWWNALELDINTEIEFAEEVIDEEELPDEITGYCESPWTG
jgi:hypothetical protein